MEEENLEYKEIPGVIEDIGSSIISDKLDIKDVEEVTPDTSVVINTIKLLMDEEQKDTIEEIKKEIVSETFLELFENFMNKGNIETFKNISIPLTSEIRIYFSFLCKQNPELFNSVELTIKKILSDDKIDAKDTPDIIMLVSKIYKIIENKEVPNIEPYELIKSFIMLSCIIYIESSKTDNSDKECLLLQLLAIIEASIDLIKLTPIKVPKELKRCKKFFICY